MAQACASIAACQPTFFSAPIGSDLPSPWVKAGVSTNRSAVGRDKPCARLWSHQLGWELRLVIDGGELQRSQVCRSNDEILDTQAQWKSAMVGKGWR
jgi:hypothetical protein